MPQLRNPVVCRGLTELRKVVNALIRQYGKPELIRVELARDLKKSRQQREDLTKQNRDNEKSRDAARKKIAERLHCDENAVSNLDILKVRLAEECNWECPYTGKSIAIEALVGKHSQFDVEHIIPFSRSLDNSFLNKTLCYHEENRGVKRNQTPYEAYAGERDAVAGDHRASEAVPRLGGPCQAAKVPAAETGRGFRRPDAARHPLHVAAGHRVSGLLYGGTIDADHTRRVQVSAGRITAYLRDEWGLNAILADGDEDEKNRDDHRHHAVDAAVIALTDAETVELLSRSAEVAAERGHRLFVLEEIKKPWPTFLDDLRRAIDAINISYRVNRRVTGALHEETHYSKPHQMHATRKARTVEYRHIRKPLQRHVGQ